MEEAVHQPHRGAVVALRPSDKTTAIGGAASRQLACEEAVSDGEVAAFLITHKAAVGAVSFDRADDFAGEVTAVNSAAVDVYLTCSMADEATGKLSRGRKLADINSQVANGGTIHVTERGSVCFGSGKRVFHIMVTVAITIIKTLEWVLTGTYHGVGVDFVILLEVNAFGVVAIGYVSGQLVPVGRTVDDVGVGCCAAAAAKLCPYRRPEGEEDEEEVEFIFFHLVLMLYLKIQRFKDLKIQGLVTLLGGNGEGANEGAKV